MNNTIKLGLASFLAASALSGYALAAGVASNVGVAANTNVANIAGVKVISSTGVNANTGLLTSGITGGNLPGGNISITPAAEAGVNLNMPLAPVNAGTGLAAPINLTTAP